MKKITLTPSNPRRVKTLSTILGLLIAVDVILKLTYFH